MEDLVCESCIRALKRLDVSYQGILRIQCHAVLRVHLEILT